MIVLIDNYDSFVFNLARYFRRLGQETHVVRHDAVGIDELRRMRPDAIVLSPGPCTPAEAGCSLDVVRQLAAEIPILGICLGHQTIGAALGGRVIRAREPVHGRTSVISHNNQCVFAGLPSPLQACRYHSLVLDPESLPGVLEVTAWTEDGTIMAVRHQQWPLVGLQFHPESILTEHGYAMLAAFLRMAGKPTSANIPTIDSELVPPAAEAPLPTTPVTF